MGGAGATLAGMLPGRATARPVARIVLLLPLSGEDAALGQMLHGIAAAAIDAVNKGRLAGARALVAQVEDWRSDPARFDALARRLAAGEGRAASLFGPCPPSGRGPLGTYLDQVDGLLWDPAGYEGGECSGGIIHGGPTPNQCLKQALPFLCAEVGRRFLLVGDEGIHSRALNRVARWALGRIGATVVAEATDDPASWLLRVRRERIDVIFCSLQGKRLAGILRAYRAAKLDPLERPIFAPTMTELDTRMVGGRLAAGHVACQPYFAGLRTLANDRFLVALRRRLGPAFVPTAVAEALWGQIHLFARAVSVLDDVDPHPVLVREAARDSEVALPQGRVRLEGENLHAALWPKIGVAENDGSFKVIARSDRRLGAEPFWGPPQGVCPAAASQPV